MDKGKGKDKEEERKRWPQVKEKFSMPFSGSDYFSKNVLPFSLRAVSRRVYQDAPMRQHDDTVVIFVRGGTGKLEANAVEYKLERACIACISPFHNYAIRPEGEKGLDVLECHFNSGAYLYIMACPYYRTESFELTREPYITELQESDALWTQELMEEIVASCGASGNRSGSDSFFLILKLMGALMSSGYHGKPVEQIVNKWY